MFGRDIISWRLEPIDLETVDRGMYQMCIELLARAIISLKCLFWARNIIAYHITLLHQCTRDNWTLFLLARTNASVTSAGKKIFSFSYCYAQLLLRAASSLLRVNVSHITANTSSMYLFFSLFYSLREESNIPVPPENSVHHEC